MKVIHLSNKFFFPFFHIQNLLKKTHTHTFWTTISKKKFPLSKIHFKKDEQNKSLMSSNLKALKYLICVFFNSQTIMVIDILTTIKSRHLWFIPVWDWNVCVSVCIYTHIYICSFYLFSIYHLDIFPFVCFVFQLSLLSLIN